MYFLGYSIINIINIKLQQVLFYPTFSEFYIKNKLVNEIHLFKAPTIIGKKGIPVIQGNTLKNIKKKLLETIKFENNLYSKYEVK